MIVEDLAVLGQAHAAAGRLEQRNAQLALQIADGFAQRGLRHVERLCRAGEMLLVRDDLKIFQILPVHKIPHFQKGGMIHDRFSTGAGR